MALLDVGTLEEAYSNKWQLLLWGIVLYIVYKVRISGVQAIAPTLLTLVMNYRLSMENSWLQPQMFLERL